MKHMQDYGNWNQELEPEVFLHSHSAPPQPISLVGSSCKMTTSLALVLVLRLRAQHQSEDSQEKF